MVNSIDHKSSVNLGMAHEVPKVFTSIWHSTCYNDDTRTTAACIGDFPPGTELVGTTSTAGPNPPTYYVAIGWLGRMFPSQTGFYLMRFLGALLFCLTLTFTFALQYFKSKSRNAWISIPLLLTPAVSSFSAVINPFAYEIAAAALFWTSAFLPDLLMPRRPAQFWRSTTLKERIWLRKSGNG